MEGTIESDKGIGLGVVFALMAGVGALGMLVVPGQVGTAWAFALAMVAAALSVVAIQAYSG